MPWHGRRAVARARRASQATRAPLRRRADTTPQPEPAAARERPQTPILALSPVLATARRLSLVWGLHCVVTEDAQDLDDMVDRACRIAVEQGYAKSGERMIVTAGVPLRTPGATNMLRIAYIGSDGLSAV